MRVKQLPTALLAIVFSTCTISVQANNAENHNWMPRQPTSNYWQAPNWSGFSAPPSYNSAPPAHNYQQRRPVGPSAQSYRRPPTYYSAPNQNMNRNTPPPPPPAGPYNNAPNPAANNYRGAPPRGQYNPGPYNGPSAFSTPGYNPNQYNRGGNNNWNNNSWNNNRFWGGSGPTTWMNPSKRNWENSWDDMINSPSRMGEMPGGWTAPEVTMPNPIDMGDQFQDNAKKLPEQIRNMNVGNDVNN